MKPRQIFSLALKIGGLWLLWGAVSCFMEAFLLGRGYAQPREFSVRYWVIWGIFQSVVSLYLLGGGKLLLDLVFPEEPEGEDEAGSETPRTDDKTKS